MDRNPDDRSTLPWSAPTLSINAYKVLHFIHDIKGLLIVRLFECISQTDKKEEPSTDSQYQNTLN
jgi:hypothetical protein